MNRRATEVEKALRLARLGSYYPTYLSVMLIVATVAAWVFGSCAFHDRPEWGAFIIPRMIGLLIMFRAHEAVTREVDQIVWWRRAWAHR